MKLVASEFEECKALMLWATWKEHEFPELRLLFHIRNEGKDRVERMRLALIGVQAGVHDYLLPVARGGKHGLWVEIKAPGGKAPSREQKRWFKEMVAQGYEAAFCWGWPVAATTIERYLKLPK